MVVVSKKLHVPECRMPGSLMKIDKQNFGNRMVRAMLFLWWPPLGMVVAASQAAAEDVTSEAGKGLHLCGSKDVYSLEVC